MKNNCETCEYKECEKYKENETKAFKEGQNAARNNSK